MGADGGAARHITGGNSEDDVPNWSQDGEWIYFSSDRTGRPEVWKIPFGGGQAVQVTKEGGFDSQESSDGKWLFYSKSDRDGIWKMPADGGPSTVLLNRRTGRFWKLTAHDIYFLDLDAKPHPEIRRLQLRDRASRPNCHNGERCSQWHLRIERLARRPLDHLSADRSGGESNHAGGEFSIEALE